MVADLKCDIDSLLKYFLYLVLDENGTKKQEIDHFQNRIEELQTKRFYEKETTNDLRSERTLIEQRDKILNNLFETSLKSVIDIANKDEVKKHLKNYCNTKGHESERYGPYVLLCNQALEYTATLGGNENLPFRTPSTLDIRFVRSDPKPTKSIYKGAGLVERKPNVGTTSLVAACDVAGTTDQSKFGEKPNKGFTWPQFLMGSEFKLKHKNLSLKFKERFQNGFSDTERHSVLDHASLENDFDLDADSTQQETSKKRDLEEDTESERPAKKRSVINGSKLSKIPTGTGSYQTTESQSKNAISARAQCASYGLEMLSHCVGVHHAINLLIIDDILWIWYYDRQGIIQSNGMSFIHDLPRFLVLLFAFQRFTLKDWGIIPQLNPNAILVHQSSEQRHNDQKMEISVDITALEKPYVNDKSNINTVKLHPNDLLFREPHCLAGRATTVIGGKGAGAIDPPELELVCKIYHPEVQRRHEGTTLQIVRHIAETEDDKMLKHLPTLYFHGDVPGCTTHRIRSLTNLDWKGHRTLRMIGLKKLDGITTTEGREFVKAWFEIVTCHSFLWKNRVEHGDPSVSNMMYDPELKCGVLTDFDLSILQWEPRVSGTDRMGTIPYMALSILTPAYWEGLVQRRHYHELESFVWILTYVFLRYHGERKHVDPWTTSNHRQCRSEKMLFLDLETLKKATDTIGLESSKTLEFKELVLSLCICVNDCNAEYNNQLAAPYRTVPRLLLDSSVRLDSGRPPNAADTPPHVQLSEYAWKYFITILEAFVTQRGSTSVFMDLLSRLRSYKPVFEDLTQEEMRKLEKKYDCFQHR